MNPDQTPQSALNYTAPQTTNYTSALTNNEGGGQTTVYTQTPASTPITPPVTPVDPTKPMNASAIGSTSPTTYPAPSTANTTAAHTQLGATTGAQALQAGAAIAPPASGTSAPATPTTPNARQSALDSILGIFKQQQHQGEDTAAANKENDVAGKQQKVTDLNNQLASTSASWDSQIENVRRNQSGAGQAYVDAQIANLTQQKNSDLAKISIQLNAANGNYTTAAAIAKQTVDAKYAPLKDELATLQSYYNLSGNDMTDSEKQQAQAVIDQKKMALQEGIDKEMATYKENLSESDPLHAAQVAEAWANEAKTKADVAAGGDNSINGLAQQLVDGLLAPSELSKRTNNYNAVLNAAQTYSQQKYGKSFSIAQAQRDYGYANNVGTQNTLNYLGSLLGTEGATGNLAELKSSSDAISRTNFPALNDAAAWTRLQAGDPNIVGYYATVTEVSDQIAKILQGGGTGSGTSDAKLAQAQKLFNSSFSKAQVNATVDAITPLLQNRAKNIIGDNPYLSDYKTSLGFDNSSAPQKVIDPSQIPSGYYQASDGLLYKK